MKQITPKQKLNGRVERRKKEKKKKLHINSLLNEEKRLEFMAGKARGAKTMSKSKRAELQFPVGRIGRFLKKGRYSKRIGNAAPVYVAAVLEYLT